MPYYIDPTDPLMREVLRVGHERVKVTLEAIEWLGIVGMLQLALRHPTFNRPDVKESEPAQAARRFIKAAKNPLGTLSPVFLELIERGDNPDYDLPL